VLDHAGCVHRHGFVTDARVWTLDGATALVPAPSRAARERTAKECPQCHAVWTGAPACPECGFALRPPARLVPTVDGELVELATGSPIDVQDQAREVGLE
jgi:hypothetical protein